MRNLLLARVPLYSQPEWAARAVPQLLGLRPAEVAQLTDDQVGRALDRLFDADRATLLTQVVVRAVNAFAVDLAQLHNDSTTVTFTGEYRRARGRTLRGRRALAIGYGHNKDHRPDLKQWLFILTVSADGAVPIHYQACDVLPVQALLEREVRRAMTARGLTSLPLYPEGRDCVAPSAHGIFQIFAGRQSHQLRRYDTLVQTFSPEPPPVQRQILDLLGISPREFTIETIS